MFPEELWLLSLPVTCHWAPVFMASEDPGGGSRAPCDLSPQWGSEQYLRDSGLDGLPSIQIGDAVARGSEHLSLGNFSICAQFPYRQGVGESWSLAS